MLLMMAFAFYRSSSRVGSQWGLDRIDPRGRPSVSSVIAMVPSLRFSVGDVVHHRLFNYRGVVIGADPQFAGTDEWYESVARSRPPKDQAWYHVLPDGATHQTYVADRNLELDASGTPIEHPLIQIYFTHFVDGRYIDARMN
jgi:heat shock protein HspQ